MPYFLVFLPIITLGLYILYVVMFIIEVKIMLKIFDRPIKEGEYKTTELNYAVFLFSLSEILIRMTESLFDKILVPKAIISEFLFNLFGSKMGKNVHISSPVLDPHLIEIGNNTIIGKHALITGHFIVGDKLTLKKVKIGNNVTIGSYAIISPGVQIQDNVVVAANSFVKKNSVLKKNSLYAGVPARFKKKITRKRQH
jgi:acetyltransferase-like isoleucine patch superfamily enzyme